MTMSPELRTREYEKFREVEGKTSINVSQVGPIQAEIINGSAGDPVLLFENISNLSKEQEEVILSFLVPAGKTFYLNQVSASGDNIAIYSLYLDGDLLEKKRSWWTQFNAEFNFLSYPISSGRLLEVRVIHYRNENSDFNGTIKGVLK